MPSFGKIILVVGAIFMTIFIYFFNSDSFDGVAVSFHAQEEEDSAIMNDPGMFRTLSKTQRMAVKHRRQEKRILRRTIAAVSKDKEKLRLPLGGIS